MFGEYLQFLYEIPDNSLIYQATYNVPLVILSIGIAIFASYTALFVSQQASQANDKLICRTLSTIGGITLGIGIWSMHFVGMLGFSIPCGISYDPLITALSMIPGILAGIFSVYIINLHNNQRSWQSHIWGGLVFGSGVGLMHYSGMAAMQMDAFLRYEPKLFVLSILVAVILATLALWIKDGIGLLFPKLKRYQMLIASCVMGLAVSGMHYTAMAAAYFLIGDVNEAAKIDNGIEPIVLAIIVSSFTGVLIGSVLLYIYIHLSRKIKRINAELTEVNNHLKYQTIALDKHAIVSIANVKGDITYVNDKFVEASGYQRSEILGKNHRLIKSNEHTTEFYEQMWDTIVQGNIWQGEIKNLSKNGCETWLNSTIVTFLDPNTKTPYQYVAVRTDISHIKATEASLRKSKIAAERKAEESLALQKLLRFSIEGHDIKTYLELSLSILIDNVSWINLLPKGGIFLNEKRGTGNCLELIASKDLSVPLLALCEKVPFGYCLCGRAASEKKIQFATCIGVRHDIAFDGMKEHGHYNVPILEDEQVLGVLVLYLPVNYQDDENEKIFLEQVADILGVGISRRYARQSQLAALEKAKAADKSKSAFLANMSHELRTPMNGILGASEILNSIAKTEEEHKYIDLIHISGTNLLSLLNDLLDFSKIEAGKMELENISFDLDLMIDHLLHLFDSKAKERKLQFLYEKDQNISQYINGDQIRLQQILINLINNAIKFTQSGEIRLVIELNQIKNILRFDVHDTGIGISSEKQSLLFNNFQQLDESTARKFGGTGLGLAISKQLVELMGGKIGVTSEVNRGSCFWFEIPYNIADESSLKRIEKNRLGLHNHPSGNEIKILLAEDNKVNQVVTKGILSKMGFPHVDIVFNGNEAIEALCEREYDIVLMDVQMPECDGLTACRIIREQISMDNKALKIRNPNIPIIALTANVMESDIKECHAAGMNSHLGKPLKSEVLKEELQKWLKS